MTAARPSAQPARVAARGARAGSSSAVCALVLCASAGLAIVAVADAISRSGRGSGQPVFWLGVAVIVGACLQAALRPDLDFHRGLAVVVVAGLALYLVKVLHSPLNFTFHDEFSTTRTADDIRLTGDLFTRNPLIPVHPVYPGLELVMTGLGSLTGLSTFWTGLIVIGIARALLVASLFVIFHAAGGVRVATLGALLYAANPNFVYFGAQVAYESFALALACAALAVLATGSPA